MLNSLGHFDLSPGDRHPKMIEENETQEKIWDILERWELKEINGGWSLEDQWAYNGHEKFQTKIFNNEKDAINQAKLENVYYIKKNGIQMLQKKLTGLTNLVFSMKRDIETLEFQVKEINSCLDVLRVE